MRWVQRYASEFEKRWRRFALAVGGSWRVDETYVKIRDLLAPIFGWFTEGFDTPDLRDSKSLLHELA